MPKLQRGWPLARPLEAALRASPLTHQQLADAAGVKYYAVRRMRLDGVKNRSRNGVALCNFFGISEPGSAPDISESDLTSAIAGIWDGTPQHGRMLLELIHCVGQYKVLPK